MAVDAERDAADSCGYRDRELLYRLLVVAVPTWPITTVSRLVGLVSAAVIGRHLDEAALAAIGLGNVITNITGFSSLWGLSGGIATLSSQDWGAGNYKALGVTLQRAFLILLCIVDLPLLLVWLNSGKLLVAAGQHPEVAHYVGLYSRVRSPGLLFMSANCVLSRTLSAISNVHINLWMSLTAALLNVCLSFLLIPWLGFVGAPITACICDAYESFGILLLASRNKDFRKCWGGFTREAFTSWGPYMRISCPALVLMCIEWWTWDLMSFLAGFISELAQAVQSVAPAVGDLQYSMGQAMGNAASTVVGNLLGEGSPTAAKRAARLMMILAATLMVVQLVAFLILRTHVARLFTTDSEILAGIVDLLPFSLAFSFIDSIQASLCGVLQGAGRQSLGAGIVFTCYWVVGVPLGLVLAFGALGIPALGLQGLWIGMLTAVCGHALLFSIAVARLDWHGITREVSGRIVSSGDPGVSLIDVSRQEAAASSAAAS